MLIYLIGAKPAWRSAKSGDKLAKPREPHPTARAQANVITSKARQTDPCLWYRSENSSPLKRKIPTFFNSKKCAFSSLIEGKLHVLQGKLISIHYLHSFLGEIWLLCATAFQDGECTLSCVKLVLATNSNTRKCSKKYKSPLSKMMR